MKERATELEFLEWFFCNADFGPADSDVRDAMTDRFMRETGKWMPVPYSTYSDGEASTDK